MKTTRILIGIGAGLAIAAVPFVGQTQTIKLRTLDTLSAGTTPSGQVIGASPAEPGKWPATFVFRNSAKVGCTATAIGLRTILTAAHCMKNGETAEVSATDPPTKIECVHNPKYPNDVSADFALCFAKANLPRPNGGFEQVNVNGAEVPVGRSITLLGYGCLQVNGIDRNFGTLFEGPAIVQAVADRDNFIRTADGAAVCSGDSGGGAYVAVGEGGIQRRLFAVNSRGDLSTNSWLSVTHKPDFVGWAKSLADNHSTRICGLHADANNCRQ